MLKRLIALIMAAVLMPVVSCSTAVAEAVSESLAAPYTENQQIEAMIDRAYTYMAEDYIEYALSCLDLAMMLDAQYPAIHAALADIAYIAGDLDAAREHAVRTTELAPTWHVGWRILFELSDGEETEMFFRYLDILGAVKKGDFLHLADSLVMCGAYEKAVSYYDRCELSWMNDEQRSMYRNALIYTGQMDRAVSLGLMDASAKDSKLAALVARDSIALEKVDLLEGYTGQNVSIYSLSPDGQRVIVQDDEPKWYVWNRQTKMLTPIVQSPDKGVADEYGNLERMLGDRKLMMQGQFVWSLDGRYAVPVNSRSVLQNMQGYIDPVLIDTYTGEAILTATWGGKLLRDENAGALVHACFSADGRYLYYTFYSGMNIKAEAMESPYRLMRYELDTGVTETVYQDLEEFPMWAFEGLFETGEGDFVTIYSPADSSDYCGVTLYQNERSGFARYKLPFDLLREHFPTSGLEFGGQSNYGIVFSSRNNDGITMSSFHPFRLVGRELLNDGYWMLRGAEEPELIHYAPEEFLDLQSKLKARDSDGAPVFGDEHRIHLDDWTITCIRMSPDGYYALIACAHHGQGRLLLYDFENHSVTPVECPEEVQANMMGSAMGTKFNPGISWCDDGTLLLLTESGAQAYRMK